MGQGIISANPVAKRGSRIPPGMILYGNAQDYKPLLGECLDPYLILEVHAYLEGQVLSIISSLSCLELDCI